MTIAPVRRETEVRQDPARAFALFTGRMVDWWRRGTPGKAPPVAIVVEPRVGGRWFERDADGVETQWGLVKAWEPPAPGAASGRLQLRWQLDAQFRFDPAVDTTVDIVFTAIAGGGTRVTLEHRELERYGDAAAHVASRISEGWPQQLAGFAAYAGAHDEEDA